MFTLRVTHIRFNTPYLFHHQVSLRTSTSIIYKLCTYMMYVRCIRYVNICYLPYVILCYVYLYA